MTIPSTTIAEAGRFGPAALPVSVWAAMKRGAAGHCPRCGGAGMFARFLKPTASCPACGQDWTLHQADDFPPYVSIFLTGHIMAPVIIALAFVTLLPVWGKMLLVAAVAAALMLALLQPAKGAIIAAQWWMGMSDFRPAGRVEAERARPDGV